MKTIIGLALMLALFGCATSTDPLWSGGGSDQAFAQDNYACVQESRTTLSGSGILVQAKANDQAQQLYRMCMEARGYEPACPAGRHLNKDRDKCKSNE